MGKSADHLEFSALRRRGIVWERENYQFRKANAAISPFNIILFNFCLVFGGPHFITIQILTS